MGKRTLKLIVGPKQQQRRLKAVLQSLQATRQQHNSLPTVEENPAEHPEPVLVNEQRMPQFNGTYEDSDVSSGCVDSYDEDSGMEECIVDIEDSLQYCVFLDEESDPSVSVNDTINREFQERLSNWVIDCNIPRTHVNELLHVLKSYPGLDFLPKDYRTLLKTVRKVVSVSISPGSYVHFGVANGIMRCLHTVKLSHVLTHCKLKVSIDGIPLTKSTNSQFWPILGLVDGIEEATPFPIGIYHGDTKPQCANDYLQLFVSELIKLENEGLLFEDNKISVSVKSFICDAPARAFISCVKGHMAYCGCTKCTCVGEYYTPNVNKRNGRVIYPDLNAPLRTDSSFRQQLQKDHHNSVSIICNLKIDMVAGFPVESMHLTDLGANRKLWQSWTKGKYERVKLSKFMREVLSKRIEACRPHIPDDFPRKLGPLDLMDRWKATCFRMLKLYLGPVLLRGILSDILYKHFLGFHVAMKLLSNEETCGNPSYLDYCEQLLRNFVKDSAKLYGKQFLSYNIHNLIHLTSDVRLYGALDSYSAYKFENKLQVVKNLVRKSAKPLPQIVKRLGEIEVNSLARDFIVGTQPVSPQHFQHFDGPLIPGISGTQLLQIVFKNWRLTCKKPNNCAYLLDQSVVLIENFVQTEGNIILIGRKFIEKINFFDYPLASSMLGCYKVKNLSGLQHWPIAQLTCKGFIVPSFIENETSFVVSKLLPHDKAT